MKVKGGKCDSQHFGMPRGICMFRWRLRVGKITGRSSGTPKGREWTGKGEIPRNGPGRACAELGKKLPLELGKGMHASMCFPLCSGSFRMAPLTWAWKWRLEWRWWSQALSCVSLLPFASFIAHLSQLRCMLHSMVQCFADSRKGRQSRRK